MATANQTPPGIEKVKTEAAAKSAMTPTTARAGRRLPLLALTPEREVKDDGERNHKIAITVSLKPD